jgi:hypothetical protein
LSFFDDARLKIKYKDGRLSIFDVAAKKIVKTYPAAEGTTNACGLWLQSDREAEIAAYTHTDCSVDILDGKTLSTRWTLPVTAGAAANSGPSSAPSLWFSPDKHHVAAVFDERLLVVYDAANGKEEVRLQLPAGMSQTSNSGSSYRLVRVGWSPDSRFLFAAQGEVFLIRIADGAQVVLSMFARGDKRVPVVSSESHFDGPADLEPCVFRAPTRPGAPLAPRTALAGLLARFIAGQ